MAAKQRVNRGRTWGLAIGTREIDAGCANCATRRDLRCSGRLANLPGVEMVGNLEEYDVSPENEENEYPIMKERKKDFDHMPVFWIFYSVFA